jgi:hypothetical protein
MARTGSKARSKVRTKLVPALIVAAVAVASVMFWKRFDIGVWYMNRNQAVREKVILHMLENAQPLIERDVKMSLPEKVFSALAGRRNEKERQSDALKDVRAFGETCFKNRWITFIKAPRSNPMTDGRFGRLRFALAWNRGRAGEVLAAFNVKFMKREIGEMQINPNCQFFVDLKMYVEKKAKAN